MEPIEKHATILIVDDESRNLIFLEELLSELQNVTILPANSGYKALDLCKEKEMALILLDLMMPGIDGFKVIEGVRETKLNKDTPVIIISGAYIENDNILIESVQKGAIDFIPKPVNPNLLLGKVRQFLNIYTQKEALKKLVTKLAQSNSKIRDNRIMLHKITSVANDAILVFNEKRKISFWNE
jgi:CheY-like chemotaxis protein